jgi:hypothetical protein
MKESIYVALGLWMSHEHILDVARNFLCLYLQGEPALVALSVRQLHELNTVR